MEMESVDLQPAVQREPALGPMRIFCKQNTNLNMAAHGNKVLLANANPDDESQHWFQLYNVGKLTDDMGRRAFVLVNSNTTTRQAMVDTTRGQAIVHTYNDVKLLPYSGNDPVRTPMLWTQGRQLEDGFTEIRTFRDRFRTLNAIGGNAVDGTVVGIWDADTWYPNAVWKIEPIRINSVV